MREFLRDFLASICTALGVVLGMLVSSRVVAPLVGAELGDELGPRMAWVAIITLGGGVGLMPGALLSGLRPRPALLGAGAIVVVSLAALFGGVLGWTVDIHLGFDGRWGQLVGSFVGLGVFAVVTQVMARRQRTGPRVQDSSSRGSLSGLTAWKRSERPSRCETHSKSLQGDA